MRGATQCAQRLKTLLGWLRSKLGRVSPPPGGDPITQMILGILSRDTPESKAREALGRIRGIVVDYNELRVIPPIELAAMLGDYSDVRLKCEDISRSLNRVFALNHAISLEHLAGTSDKEVRAYLDQIDGLEAYTRARVRLLGLQRHAIPLDEAMWAYGRQERIVDRRCPLAQAQGFLERQISKDDALEFVALLRRQAWSEMGSAVRDGKVEQICSIPPDRTARNMLRLLESPVDEAALEPEPAPVADPPVKTAAAEKPPRARRKRAAPRIRKTASPTRKAAASSASRSKSRKPSKPKPKPAKSRAKGKARKTRAALRKKAAARKRNKPAKTAATRAKAGRESRTRTSTGKSKPRARSA